MQSVPITTKVVSLIPTRYNIMWLSLSVTCGRSVLVFWVLLFPPPIKWLPWYNRNIIGSDIKHHDPHPPLKKANSWNLSKNGFIIFFYNIVIFMRPQKWCRYPMLLVCRHLLFVNTVVSVQSFLFYVTDPSEFLTQWSLCPDFRSGRIWKIIALLLFQSRCPKVPIKVCFCMCSDCCSSVFNEDFWITSIRKSLSVLLCKYYHSWQIIFFQIWTFLFYIQF